MFVQLALCRSRNDGSCDVPREYTVEVSGEGAVEERAAEEGGAGGVPSRSPPEGKKRMKLGRWVQDMRRWRRLLDAPPASDAPAGEKRQKELSDARAVLTPGRIEALDRLGFAWGGDRKRRFQEDAWEDKY